MAMQLISKDFEGLSTNELYAILALRTEIFVVEQECAYQEVDGYDQVSQHIIGVSDNKIVAYARNVPPKSIYTEPSIGRVAVSKEYRQMKYGKQLFEKALLEIQKSYPTNPIKIQAQTYLENFYKSFGFKTISEPYPDIGVWHIDMLLNHQS